MSLRQPASSRPRRQAHSPPEFRWQSRRYLSGNHRTLSVFLSNPIGSRAVRCRSQRCNRSLSSSEPLTPAAGQTGKYHSVALCTKTLRGFLRHSAPEISFDILGSADMSAFGQWPTDNWLTCLSVIGLGMAPFENQRHLSHTPCAFPEYGDGVFTGLVAVSQHPRFSVSRAAKRSLLRHSPSSDFDCAFRGAFFTFRSQSGIYPAPGKPRSEGMRLRGSQTHHRQEFRDCPRLERFGYNSAQQSDLHLHLTVDVDPMTYVPMCSTS